MLVVFVLGAFIAASLADLGAQAADFLCKGTVSGHGRSGQCANVSTFAIQSDAIGHHLNVIFL